MTKIETFKSFSQLQNQLREEAKQKEIASKREAKVAEFNELLSKYNVASISDLNEDEREEFMSQLTAEGNAFGDAVRKAKEAGEEEFEFDGKTYKVTEDEDESEDEESMDIEEGRAFVAAARKAKDEGKEEFEYNGKKYPVLLKEGKEVAEIMEANKRQVDAVVKSYIAYVEKFSVFSKMTDVMMLWTVKEILKAALVNANYHSEAEMVAKYVTPAKFENVEIAPMELGGRMYIKVPKKSIMDIVDLVSSNVSNSAKWDGYAIIEGTAEYLSTVRPGKKSAEGLRAALAALQA